MKGRGMKCVLIVLGVLTWWLSCLPYPCREHNRTPGSMPARPRRSFTPKKWFENCSSSNIAIKLVLGSGSELELEWFLWKKEKRTENQCPSTASELCRGLQLSPKLKNPLEISNFTLNYHLLWLISFLLLSSLPLWFHSLLHAKQAFSPRRHLLPGHSGVLSPSSSAPFQAWTAATLWPPWVDGKATVACRAGMKLEHSRYRFLDLDMDASFLGLRPQGLV